MRFIFFSAALGAASALACSGGATHANGDAENADTAAGAATISFSAVAFDPKNPAPFEPVVTGSLKAGARTTVRYDAARLQKNGVSCAAGAPLRMGQKINLDPKRAQEVPLTNGKVTLDLPKDASTLELWFVCAGAGGDQFDNDNPQHLAGLAPNYGFDVGGGSGLLFAGAQDVDARGNAFRAFVRTTKTPLTSGETQAAVDVHVEYTDITHIFGSAPEVVFGVNGKVITTDAEGHVSETVCDLRQVTDNERKNVDFFSSDPSLCLQGSLKLAGGVFAGDLTKPLTLVGSDSDEHRFVPSFDVFFSANGVFDSANGNNYTIRLSVKEPSAP